MRAELIQRTASLLLHDDASGRPASGLEFMQLGNWAVVFSLRGAGFYDLLAASGLDTFRAQGIDTVLAAVSAVHMRAMRQRLAGVTVQELEPVNIGGQSMHLVIIRDQQT
jgi:hypothetical protein